MCAKILLTKDDLKGLIYLLRAPLFMIQGKKLTKFGLFINLSVYLIEKIVIRTFLLINGIDSS